MKSITLAEHNLLPDSLVRFGIRKLLKQRLQDESSHGKEQRYELLLENLRQSPIAIETLAANAQHTKSQQHFINLPWVNTSNTPHVTGMSKPKILIKQKLGC